MGIELKCFVTLAQYMPENSDDYPIEPGETIRSLVEKLGMPVKNVTLMFVNSVRSDLDTEIRNGDRVGLFPPVGGG